MFTIPMDGPTNVFFDNQSVCNNVQMTASTSKKKKIAICYHLVRELYVGSVMRVEWDIGKANLSGVLKKLMPDTKKQYICGKLMGR